MKMIATESGLIKATEKEIEQAVPFALLDDNSTVKLANGAFCTTTGDGRYYDAAGNRVYEVADYDFSGKEVNNSVSIGLLVN